MGERAGVERRRRGEGKEKIEGMMEGRGRKEGMGHSDWGGDCATAPRGDRRHWSPLQDSKGNLSAGVNIRRVGKFCPLYLKNGLRDRLITRMLHGSALRCVRSHSRSIWNMANLTPL